MSGDTALYFLCAAFMIAGMTAGATSMAIAYSPASIAFAVPALSFLIYVFALENEPVSWLMAFVTVIYGLMLIRIGRQSEKATRALLRQKDIIRDQNTILSEHRALMQQVLDTIEQGVAVYDADLTLIYWNPALMEYLGISTDWPEQPRKMEDLIRKLAELGEYGSGNIEEIVRKRMKRVEKSGNSLAHRYERKRPNGKQVKLVGNPMSDGGLVVTYTDITEHYEHIEEIKRIAEHDSLTGLVNRRAFLRQLENAMSNSRRNDRIVSVYFLDLDHFKDINDTLGHPVGDALLQSVATRLLKVVRDTDTVARLGGDEFAIIGVNHKEVDDCIRFADRILKSLSEPHELAETTVLSGVSIGVTIYPLDNCDAVDLQSHADVALYKAKQAGRNTFAIFDEDMNKELTERKTVEKDLVTAISNEELLLYYQPQIDLQNGKMLSAEALIRWDHPSRGILSPASFIEIAEKSRLLEGISEWVIDESIAFLGRLRTSGIEKFRLSINLSAADFRNEHLCSKIQTALEKHGVPGDMLGIEITESMIITDLQSAMISVSNLKDMGISIAIDDFGIGYSSMSYLKNFAADVLKIDRSFIMDGFEDNKNAKIVNGIINLGHSLDMTVVAEGIEDEAQETFLTNAGCEIGQGYLFARPMPEQEFLDRFDLSNATPLKSCV